MLVICHSFPSCPLWQHRSVFYVWESVAYVLYDIFSTWCFFFLWEEIKPLIQLLKTFTKCYALNCAPPPKLIDWALIFSVTAFGHRGLRDWLRLHEIRSLGPNATGLRSSWEEEGSPHLFLHAVIVKRQWGTPQEGGLSTGREVPSEPNPADTLSLGVQPPEPWEKQVSIVSVTQSVVFVWQPKQTNTLDYWVLLFILSVISNIMFFLEFDYLLTYIGIKFSECLIFMFLSVIILSL